MLSLKSLILVVVVAGALIGCGDDSMSGAVKADPAGKNRFKKPEGLTTGQPAEAPKGIGSAASKPTHGYSYGGGHIGGN